MVTESGKTQTTHVPPSPRTPSGSLAREQAVATPPPDAMIHLSSSDHHKTAILWPSNASNGGGDFHGPITGIDLSKRSKESLSAASAAARKQREFIPDNKKDESYWDRRRRNNEAAKRSREKRRLNDMVLETRVLELTKENAVLRAQLVAIRDKYGISGENLVNPEQVPVALPPSDPVAINLSKRNKLLVTGGLPMVSQVGPGGMAGMPLRPLLVTSQHSPVGHHNGKQLYEQMECNNNNNNHSPNHNCGHRNYLGDVKEEALAEMVTLYNCCRLPADVGGLYSARMPPTSSHSPPAMNGSHHAYMHRAEIPIYDNQRRGSACSDNSLSDVAHNDGCSSGDESRSARSPSGGSENGVSVCYANLPHKLRHKSHLGEKEGTNCSGSNGYRSPPVVQPIVTCDDLSSGHEASGDEAPTPKKRRQSDGGVIGGLSNLSVASDDLESENCQLKSQLQRLACEVASLKDMMLSSRDSVVCSGHAHDQPPTLEPAVSPHADP